MRDSGNDPKRILKSISKDKGETWSFATDTKIPNPSSSVEVLQLKNGNWIMACNDTESNRNQMAILLSFNEGKSWDVKKYIGKHEHNSGITLAYPSLIVIGSISFVVIKSPNFKKFSWFISMNMHFHSIFCASKNNTIS